MGKRLVLAGCSATLAIAALMLAWPEGNSERAGRSQVAWLPQSTPARFLPHPLFASAQGRHGTAVSLADVAEASLPSVVNISSVRVVASQRPQGQPFFDDPFFRRFFGDDALPSNGQRRERLQQSLGSGVVVSDEGLVLTNNHVIANAERIRIALSNGRELEAKVVGADPKSDLAVLRLKGRVPQLHAVRFGNSDLLRLGDVVLAIGNPFGVGQTVTMGIVSAKGRADMGIVDYEDFIQTDAAINPGNSGGALINMAGELVGINTAILSRTGGFQGIGFTIPSNMAKPIMVSLLKYGKVVRGWLGIAIQELTPELAQALHLQVSEGVVVSDVTEDSPAARAGIQRGDVLLSFNGKKMESAARLRNLVASTAVGTDVQLLINRKGQRLPIFVRLGELPAAIGGTGLSDDRDRPFGGLGLAELDTQSRRRFEIPERLRDGVVVQEVSPRSPAARAGAEPGDVILEIDRQVVRSIDEFRRLYQRASKRILLLVYRAGSTRYLIIAR